MRVFIDTSAFLALLIATESFHETCIAKYRAYTKEHAQFYTNVLVLAELYTRLVYDFNKQACGKVIMHINRLQEEENLKVLQLDAALFGQAEKALLRFAEHKLSLTDASIYVAAKWYDMDEIFTLDQDFKKVGLKDAGLR
jgi:predicted nucleic acid-binding protein